MDEATLRAVDDAQRRGLALIALVAVPALALYQFAEAPLHWAAAAPYLPVVPGLLLVGISRRRNRRSPIRTSTIEPIASRLQRSPVKRNRNQWWPVF